MRSGITGFLDADSRGFTNVGHAVLDRHCMAGSRLPEWRE
ncbi:hypothetical protein BURPS668_1694 [Burkholderia pseudomallei 668]|nr:hypothetical protein BURPS668_1694 [Burkholderia pseudomallei 668]